MATVGRVLLWTVVLVAPGGFLLVPVLAAASLQGAPGRPRTLRESLADMLRQVRLRLSTLPLRLRRYWTKS